MTQPPTSAPRALSLGAGQIGQTGNVDNADTKLHYTTAAPSSLPQWPCRCFVIWLCCRACLRDFFTASVTGVEPCPACVGSRPQPMALWNLTHETAPPGMLRRRRV
jgi:hypothetical protein